MLSLLILGIALIVVGGLVARVGGPRIASSGCIGAGIVNLSLGIAFYVF